MDGLIIVIIWGVIISKIIKAAKGEEKDKVRKTTQVRREWANQRQAVQQKQVRRTTQAERDAYYYNQQKNTKARLQQKYGVQSKQNQQADILGRAKENVLLNEADTVEQQIHAEVCRDYREDSHKDVNVDAHKASSEHCDTGETSDLIKRVNDLIVTGYSGEMYFDRDFIAEGIDMLNQYSL